ncbi:MAG: hypothetical protein H7343_04140 [Undibacterium sp.]|nr:hypothetical protein [Opitutaceae bacterium]
MKKPGLILALVVVLVGLALIFRGRKPHGAPAANSATTNALPTTGSTNPTATTPSTTAVAPKQTVTIRDGKTLDFSSGKPVLKDSATEKAIIEQSLKDMNEAAAGVTFGPTPKSPDPDAKKPAPQE